MDAQLNLFPHPEHSPAQAVCALSVEEGLGIEEGGSMSKSRGQTRPSEAEPTGGPAASDDDTRTALSGRLPRLPCDRTFRVDRYGLRRSTLQPAERI